MTIFISDKNEQEINNKAKNKKEDCSIKKILLNFLNRLVVLLAGNEESNSIRENFIKEILIEIPELSTSKFLVNIIEEIFGDLEIDIGLLEKFNNVSGDTRCETKQDQEKVNKSCLEALKKNDSRLNLNNLNNFRIRNFNLPQNIPNITHGSKRRTSFDMSENSLDKQKEKEEKNNYTIDKYFKPIINNTKLSYSNSNIYERKNDRNVLTIGNSCLMNSNIEISSNILKNSKDYNNSFKEFDSFKTKTSRTSVKSIYSEDLDGMSLNSNSKKNSSLMLDIQTQNSNLFNTEYSKISYESNLKRININTSVSTPSRGYRLSYPQNFSAKSNNISQNSMAISQFSSHAVNSAKPIINKYYTPHSNSVSEFHTNNNKSFSQSNLQPLNSILFSNRNRKMENYSLIAAKTSNVKHSRNNSEADIKSILTNDNCDNKVKKVKVTIIQKLLEKCGRNSNGKSSEKNKYKKTSGDKDRKKLKSIIDGSFYNQQTFLIKSPDVFKKKVSDKNLEKTRDSTEKVAEKTRQNQETPISENKLLNNKRHSDRKEERRLTRAVAKKEEFQAKKVNTRSAEKSITDDEVLAYQTPIKINQVIPINNLKTSPGVTTRKNLINLFQQIDKSA